MSEIEDRLVDTHLLSTVLREQDAADPRLFRCGVNELLDGGERLRCAVDLPVVTRHGQVDGRGIPTDADRADTLRVDPSGSLDRVDRPRRHWICVGELHQIGIERDHRKSAADAVDRSRLAANTAHMDADRRETIAREVHDLMVDRGRLRRQGRRGRDCRRRRARCDRRRGLLRDRSVCRRPLEEHRSQRAGGHDRRGERSHPPERRARFEGTDPDARTVIGRLIYLGGLDRAGQRAAEDLVVTRFVRLHRIAPRARRPAIWTWRSFSIA